MAALLKVGRLDLLTGQKEKTLLSYFDKVIVFTYTHDKEKHAHIVKQFRKKYRNRLKVIDLNAENDRLNAHKKAGEKFHILHITYS